MDIETTRHDQVVVLRPRGRLDVGTASHFLKAVEREFKQTPGRGLRVDLADLEFMDSAGAAVLIEAYHRAKRRRVSYALRNLTPEARRIFALTESGALLEPPDARPPGGPGFLEAIGDSTLGMLATARDFVRLTGRVLFTLMDAPFRARNPIRWNYVLLYMQRVGWDAIPIVTVIFLLVGMVLAMQTAAQLVRYGAGIFVADFLAISLTRELGPLITAVLLAGRSGSAFAAEIGAMKVNEEIDAMKTMGVSPVDFLVLPKFIALILMMPCLVIWANTMGIFGGFLMGITDLGLSPRLYVQQTFKAMQAQDVITGLIKSVVFAGLIAAMGCQRGFEVESDADSVGRKTTSSVVTSIFLVILADAFFTALFYVIE